MNREKFISKIQSGQTCHYIYKKNERNENTGVIKVWFYNQQIILTWEECPEGLQYDESSYSKDDVYDFRNWEELDTFFSENNIQYSYFES